MPTRIPPVELASAYQALVTDDVREAACEILVAEEAEIVTLRPSEVSARVATRDPLDRIQVHGVRLVASGNQWSFRCTCQHPEITVVPRCPHVWATMLEVGDPEDLIAELDGWSSAPLQGPSGDGPSHAVPAAKTLPPPPPKWQRKLSHVFQDLPAAAAGTWPGTRGGIRVLYVLDVDESMMVGIPCVRALGQTRLKSGAWGKLRNLTADDPEHLSSEDRRLLDDLETTTPPDATGFLRYRHRSGHRGRTYALAAPQAARVLPELCATGRLVSNEGEPTWSIAWDGDTSHVLALRLAPDGADAVTLDATLERGDEVLLARDTALFQHAGLALCGFRLLSVDLPSSEGWVQRLLAEGAIRAPANGAFDLLDRVAALPTRAPIRVDPDLADELLEVVEHRAPVPCLRVSAPATAARPGPKARLSCTLSFDYGDDRELSVLQPGATVLLGDGASGPVTLLGRDIATESAAAARLTALGATPARDPDQHEHATLPASRLPEIVTTLAAEGWRVEAEGKLHRPPGRFRLSATTGIDWFELEGALDFGGVDAPLPALLAALEKRSRYVVLGDGSVGVLPEAWLDDWGLLELLVTPARRRGATSGDADSLVRVPRSQGWLLDALLAARGARSAADVASARGQDFTLEADSGLGELRARLTRATELRPGVEPEGFHGTLRPYQRDALGWLRFLREVGLGGCLADDMGLGKTIQVLAMLAERHAAGEAQGPTLVVAPRSLTFNWLEEAARFTPNLRTLDWTGTERKARGLEVIAEHDLVVTTYGTLVRDVPGLDDVAFDYVILDESQAIKNPASLAAKAARLLGAEHRLALSGTPIENHLGELWSLFEFLNPGMLGRARRFQELAAAAEASTEGPTASDGRSLLGAALRPFFLRRTKEAVLGDLPEKTEQVIHCVMKDAERREYEAVRDHYRTMLLERLDRDGLEGSKIHVLEALLRLRQAACHPGLIDPGRAGASSAKLDALLPQLHEVVESGHKALVFSQFTRMLDIVSERLERAGVVHERLDGKTRDRRQRVTRFQEDAACRVFLISLKAGGLGLNLTAADYVFLLDPWWNPAVEQQAIDRAHRFGQQLPVTAYRLVTQGTVEERVIELQARKRELAEAILGDGAVTLRDLTREDLLELLA